MSFLTVEDINSTLFKYGNVNTLHSIDTSKIGTDEFEDVMYDFCICTHTISGDNHTFSFQVRNNLWTGRYYFTDKDGNYIDADADLYNNAIHLTTTEDSIIFVLYLTNLENIFSYERLSWVSNDLKNVDLLYNSEEEPVFHIEMLDGSSATGTVLFSFDEYSTTETISDGSVKYGLNDGTNYFNGVVKVTYDGCSYYFQSDLIKNVVPIFINDTVIASKVNTVNLTIPSEFTDLDSGTVFYNGNEIPVDFTDNSFELDLREKLDSKSVKLQLEIDETETTMRYTYDFVVPCEFLKVATAESLLAELSNVTGCRVIELFDDIDLYSNILISHDTKIIGKNHSININEHSFILSEDVSVKAENISFSVGNPAFIQRINSSLNLESCTFTNCKAENYNNLGSVVLCDIDLDSLSVEEDFITTITNCKFINNHSCILQGGQLTVDNCTFRNNNLEYADKNNVAFLHQVDGDAVITNSIFDIDYTDDDFCSQQKNIGFAQAIFKCGLNATVNSATHDYLASDEKALFCEAPYNNISHLFAKYYYPAIETCVYSSPESSREIKSLCYAVSEVNWAFKENVQVTRVSEDLQNENRYITWEE